MSDPAPRRIVLAYSGGLDTSIIVPWLREHYAAGVIASPPTSGKARSSRASARKPSPPAPPSRYIERPPTRVRHRYVWPTLRAGAVYGRKYLLGTAMARPLIAKRRWKSRAPSTPTPSPTARPARATTRSGSSSTTPHFDPSVKVIAPWREWNIRSRAATHRLRRRARHPRHGDPEKPYSMRPQIVARLARGRRPRGPRWRSRRDEMFLLTRRPEPPRLATPEAQSIDFVAGNAGLGQRRALLAGDALVETSTPSAGEHGVGRIDVVEDRFVGMKSRGVYETPERHPAPQGASAPSSSSSSTAGMRLRQGARRPPSTRRSFTRALVVARARGVQTCSSTPRSAHDRLHHASPLQGHRDGRPAARAAHRCTDERFVTFGEDDVYQQSDAAGFIRLYALRLRVRRS